MESSHKTVIALLAIVALLSAANLGITTLGVSSPVDQPVPVTDNQITQTDTTSSTSDNAAITQVKGLAISGNNISGDSFTLTVPASIVVIPDGSGVRLQSYSQSLDQMPAGGFFMYINQGVKDDGNMATSRETTTTLKYLDKDVVRGDGCGVLSGECGGITRTYYFVRKEVMVHIYAHDTAGRDAAEKVLQGLTWKTVEKISWHVEGAPGEEQNIVVNIRFADQGTRGKLIDTGRGCDPANVPRELELGRMRCYYALSGVDYVATQSSNGRVIIERHVDSAQDGSIQKTVVWETGGYQYD